MLSKNLAKELRKPENQNRLKTGKSNNNNRKQRKSFSPEMNDLMLIAYHTHAVLALNK